jgi:hypothetical protein
MALSAVQRRLREGKITASFLPSLMAGDESAIHNKWLELIGDPRFVPEDFEDNWPVQFGSFIEGFALDWHARKTGWPLVRRGEVVQHPTRDNFCCTLDGFREHDRCALDCKAVNAFTPVDDTVAFYTSQMIGQRACLVCDKVAILLVHGGGEPQEIPLQIDPDYEGQVWQRVDQFWRCVESLTPPVHLNLKRVVPPEQWRSIDFDADGEKPNWAADMAPLLQIWLETEAGHKRCEESKAKIKELLPDDVGKLFAGDALVSRNRAGAVSIKRKAAK